jgi:hypothetical protein
VKRIAAENPHGDGNLYRFCAALASELTTPGEGTARALTRLAGGEYRAVLYKRVWMVVMFLRRDNGMIRCLVERSLAGCAGGRDAARVWYDEAVFPTSESELPVDTRMLDIGRLLFGGPSLKEKAVMEKAHAWGQERHMAPSALDVLFFSGDAGAGPVGTEAGAGDGRLVS